MCGICGYIDFKHKSPDQQLGHKMVETLQHRGPDNQQVWVDDNLVLCHARLSILDVSAAGNQPMILDKGSLAIVFNGEIYNFLELRNELRTKGYTFTTGTDTEVIIYGYKEWGEKLFPRLNGIFAMALLDKKNNQLIIVRDRFGVKPLYIYKDKDILLFASEIKAILVSGRIEPRINWQSFNEFLYYGNPTGHQTLFKGIDKLKPGHFLKVHTISHEIVEKPFWTVSEISLQKDVKEDDAITAIRQKLESAVKRQLISDVPVGVFLSGGIDSSSVTAFASKHYKGRISTFSAGFDFDMGINELPKARRVADHFKTDHHELFIKGGNILDTIHDLVYHHDEPFSDAANIPLYLLTKQLNGTPKVILQGDGGDELFAGYRRYNILNNISLWRAIAYPILAFSKLSGRNRKSLQARRFMGALVQRSDAMRMALLLTVENLYDTPENVLTPAIKDQMQGTDPFADYKFLNEKFLDLDPVQRMLWIDTQIILPQTFLEKVDKSTMANGIEVRVPFLDNELATYAMSLPSNLKVRNGQKKYILKKALRGIVPDDILDGPKYGFGVPYGNWLKGPLKEFMLGLINDETVRHKEIFNYDYLNRIFQLHITGKEDHGFLLWKMMNFTIWLKKYNVKLD